MNEQRLGYCACCFRRCCARWAPAALDGLLLFRLSCCCSACAANRPQSPVHLLSSTSARAFLAGRSAVLQTVRQSRRTSEGGFRALRIPPKVHPRTQLVGGRWGWHYASPASQALKVCDRVTRRSGKSGARWSCRRARSTRRCHRA